MILQGSMKLIKRFDRGLRASEESTPVFVRTYPANINKKIVICKFNKFAISTIAVPPEKQSYCIAEMD